MSYEVTTASSHDHLVGIHSLQKQNLKRSLTSEEINSQGFVTCDHSTEMLSLMNAPFPHIIGLHEDKVVSYALVMLNHLRTEIPEILPMFGQIDNIIYNDKPLKYSDYFVMGQICVGKEHRSKGLFDRMYDHMRAKMQGRFSFCITDIASENMRSRNAHRRVGFEEIHTYTDAKTDVSWEIVIWDWL